MLQTGVDTCCEYASWNDGTSDCYLHSSDNTFEQVDGLDEGTTSTQIFRYTELDEYVEPEEDDWDEYDEEDWDDWYGGCDWQNACFISIGDMHFFCQE